MQIAIEHFSENCLSFISNIKKSDKEIIILQDGMPIAKVLPVKEHKKKQPKSIFGCLRGMAVIKGDIVESVGIKWEADE